MAFLSLAVALLLLSFVSNAGSCTEQEKRSLLRFHAGLSQDGGLTASWRHDTDCCAWEGISCSGNGAVAEVSLPSRGLEGSVSPSLGELNGLLRLKLSYNALSGDFPLELLASGSVMILDMSFNHLTGGLTELPPSTPGRPMPLQVLNISSNLLTGQFPSIAWETMSNLIVLNASNNSFTGKIPTSFCASAPSFAVLNLRYNQFSGSIPPGLSKCSRLTMLSVGDNSLSGDLPDELFMITMLEHLSFHHNMLGGELSGMIIKLTNLATLDLGRNRLRGKIPISIGHLKRLEKLNLEYNMMFGELPSTLGSCSALMTVTLRGNNFSGELHKQSNCITAILQ